MPEQTTPLTYEGMLELFRETRRMIRETSKQMKKTKRMIQETSKQMKETDERLNLRFQKTDEQIKKTDEQIRQTHKDVAGLTSSVGALVASMVKGNIVEKFEALGYDDLDRCCEKQKFRNKKLGIRGEIDLFIENGDVAILVEVKTTLETQDVRKHLERLEKFRRYTDARGVDQRRFIGAVAGAVVDDDVADFAIENGLYVIVQSGEAVEILPQPDGFVAKQW